MSYLRGVADSGPEFGGTFPGTVNVDYHYDGAGTVAYLASRGHKIIRLPFSWERLQPTRGAALDTTQLGYIQTYIANAHAAGMQVVLDMHNYCRRVEGGVTKVMYTDFPDTDLSGAWTLISTALKGTPGLLAYEIMNEPNTLPALVGTYTPTTNVADFDTTGLTLTGWGINGGEPVTFAISTAQAQGGTHSLGCTATTWAASGFDDVRLWDRQNTYTYPGTNGTISAWVYAPSTAGTNLQAYIALVTSTGSEDKSANVNLTANTWTQLTWTPAAASWTGNQGLRIQISANAAGGTPTFYVDTITTGTKPPDTPPQTRWQNSSQAVLNAIRGNSDNTPIWIDGYSWASAFHWTTNHPTPWITDSANATVYVAHHYCGVNENGNFLTYAQENADAVSAGYASLADQAVQRLQVFTNWCQSNAVQGAVTEIAWRGDESTASWNAVGDAMYRELDAKSIHATYWGAGEWWPALAASMPAWYGVYTNGTGGGTSPVSVANPQYPVIEAHLGAGVVGGSPQPQAVGALTLGHGRPALLLGNPGNAIRAGSSSLVVM